MKLVRRVSIYSVLALLTILSMIPWSRSVAFEQQSFPDAFGRSWGWPFSAWSVANNEGVDLIDASVVMNGSLVFRDIVPGKYPHLAINSTFAIIDLVVVASIVLVTYVVATAIEKRLLTTR